MKAIEIEKTLAACSQVINVVDFGADPSGATDSTEAIRQALNFSKNIEGPKVIDFPEGTYQLRKESAQKRTVHTSNTDSVDYPEKTIALLVEEQQDLILNGNGSLFQIHGDSMALAVIRSQNIHLYNFSWDLVVPTVIEMRIDGTGEENGEMYTDFSIPSCFTYEVENNGKKIHWHGGNNQATNTPYWQTYNDNNLVTIVAYHPDQDVKKRYPLAEGPFAASYTRIVPIGQECVRIYYGNERPTLHQKDVQFEFTARPDRHTAGAFIWESSDVVVEKVTVHYLDGFGWLTQMAYNVSFLHCTFEPRVGTGRYATGFADLIHVSGASGLIRIEGCYFSHAHDDAINIHGTFTRVEEQLDDWTLKLSYVHRQQGGFPQYYPGNEVAFYRRDTLNNTFNPEVYTVIDVVHPGQSGNDGKTMIVTFHQPLPEGIASKVKGEGLYVAENVTYTPTVIIRDNLFEAIPTRGILCTTQKKVLIEGNTFRHMAMDTIFISNDSQDWYESGPVRDVMIRDNHFYLMKIGYPNLPNALIRVKPITLGGKLPGPKQAIHKNIRIIDNTIYTQGNTILSAESVSGLTFTGNTISNYQPVQNPEFSKTKLYDIDGMSGDAVQFEYKACEKVLVEHNQF